MHHLIAILALAAACALWFVVQRWAGRDGEAPCDTCKAPGCARRTSEPAASGARTPSGAGLGS
jgi:hypothetical protein